MLDKILLLVPVWLLLDLYFFQVLKNAAGGYHRTVRRGIYWLYWAFDMVLISALLYIKLSGSGVFSSGYFFLLVGPALLSILPKLLVLPFLLLEDFGRAGSYAAGYRKKIFPAGESSRFSRPP